MDPMDAIKQTFFQECEEQLAELESGLLAMDAGAGDSETVNAVFRAVHSVKGGAGAFGLDELVRFAHVFETTLDAVRSDRLHAGPPVLKVMLRAADVLADQVRAARDGTAGNSAATDASRSELTALQPGANAPSPGQVDDGMAGLVFQPVPVVFHSEPQAAPACWSVHFRPHAAMYAKANDTATLLRELSLLGEAAVTLHADDLPDLADLDPEGAYLAWTVDLQTSHAVSAIREVFEFVENDCDLTITAAMPSEDCPVPALDVDAFIQALRPSAGPTEPVASPAATPIAALARPTREEAVAPNPTIRVDLDRVDRLIDLVGELVINGAMLAQRAGEAGIARASGVAVALEELEHLTRDIQDSVMAIRAQPVKSVFARMPRLAREVAALTGKQVRLTTEGEGTEVDKTVIEHLADPLTHMIRNAIDHGLETPEVRRQLGKPEEGTVRLQALHRSGRIVIEVSDDGAGIDRPRVRASAIAKGLVPAGSCAERRGDRQPHLHAGLLDGGERVRHLGPRRRHGCGEAIDPGPGRPHRDRLAPGQGSTFTLSLPLTLAVLDGMVVTVAGQTLDRAAHRASWRHCSPASRRSTTWGTARASICIRGVYLPMIDVAEALGWVSSRGGSETADRERQCGVALLVEREDGSRAVLLVDAIRGQRQVVIKSLEANYRRVPGVAAATILGDGRVALILDVDSILSRRTRRTTWCGPPTPIRSRLCLT